MNRRLLFPLLSIALFLVSFTGCQNALSKPSSDASLSALSLSAGGAAVDLSPSFSSTTTAYKANVANSVTSVTVAATAADAGAVIAGTGAASLSVGANTITVDVTAADGATKSSYTITVNRASPAASSDASLSSLSLSAGGSAVALSPSFASGTLDYSANVASKVASLTVAATPTDSGALVSGAGEAKLAIGVNAITVTVTAADGTTKKTYSISVTRVLSNDASLASLALIVGDSKLRLSPDFVGSTTAYATKAPNAATSITVEAKATEKDATIDCPSTVDFAAGKDDALIKITVTAADGATKKTYSVAVVRVASGASTEASLASLSLSQGGSDVYFGPSFSSDTVKYSVYDNQPNTVTSLDVAATAAAGTIVSGTGSVALHSGVNAIEVVVLAADGATTKIYTITVNRAPLLADYAGSWECTTPDSPPRSLTMMIQSNGSFAYTEVGPGPVMTTNGSATVDVTGEATLTATTRASAMPYSYSSSADTLTLGKMILKRVAGTGVAGTRVGDFSMTDEMGTVTISMKSDKTCTRSVGGNTQNGTYDASNIYFSSPANNVYTATLDYTKPQLTMKLEEIVSGYTSSYNFIKQ